MGNTRRPTPSVYHCDFQPLTTVTVGYADIFLVKKSKHINWLGQKNAKGATSCVTEILLIINFLPSFITTTTIGLSF